MKKALSILLALLMLAPTVLASCAESTSDETETTDTPAGNDTSVVEETETETENPYYEGYVDPFEGVKFDGQTFMVHNSISPSFGTMPPSTNLIEGPEAYTGDAAYDAAYDRNLSVETALDIDLQFDPVEYSWSKVAEGVRTLIQSGDTSYDLIINDMLGLSSLSPEGLFYNVADAENFDFDAPWWYDDFMKDISITEDLRFALAGDFFIDILRACHILYMNKDVYTELQLGSDPDEIYATVINNEWTLDKFIELTSKCYVDTNGDGTTDAGDKYGLLLATSWGPLAPFLVSTDPGYIVRDDNGYPTLNIQTERSVTLVEKLTGLYNAQYSRVNIETNEDTVSMFSQGQSLFLGYQRLGTLEGEAIRAADIPIAVLPYPKFDESQESYITSSHDISELGVIPITVTGERIDFVSTVIEMLCRESYKQVLPIYYESSLKIKYTRDEASAQMVDIIHDNFGNAFALAYSSYINNFLKNIYAAPIMNNDGTFVSLVESLNDAAAQKLQELITTTEQLLKGGQ